MAGWFTRRRSIGVLIAILAVGGLAGGVGLRASKRAAAEAADKAAIVTLEFAAADLAFVEPAALTRWLPLSGTLQPVDQTTVKSKVSGEIRQVTVREGQAVKAGQVIVRFDTASRGEAHRPRRRAGSQPRPTCAGRKDAGAESAAAQTELHLSDRV